MSNLPAKIQSGCRPDSWNRILATSHLAEGMLSTSQTHRCTSTFSTLEFSCYSQLFWHESHSVIKHENHYFLMILIRSFPGSEGWVLTSTVGNAPSQSTLSPGLKTHLLPLFFLNWLHEACSQNISTDEKRICPPPSSTATSYNHHGQRTPIH